MHVDERDFWGSHIDHRQAGADSRTETRPRCWLQSPRIWIGLIVAISISHRLRGAEGPQAVQEIVNRLPTTNPATDAKEAARIVALGSPAVDAICKMLIPLGSGDDTKARYA